MNIKTTVCSLIAVLFLISCDDDTAGLGGSLTPADDIITVIPDSCFAESHTIKAMDSLYARTSQCSLGKYTEPVYNSVFKADYITQLYCMDNMVLADSIYGIGNHTFPQWFIDTVGTNKPYYANIRIYYSNYFGDPTNPIKIEVFPLNRTIDTKKKYYSDTDLEQFCDMNAQPLATVTVSATNFQVSDSLREQSNYYPYIKIPLPDSIAKTILEAYDNPDTRYYFTESRTFMDNLIKGFYIRCSQGDGTVIYVDYTALEVNFKFIGQDDDGNYVMRSLMAEFLGNSEVLQINSIKWDNIDSQVADNSATWIRTPEGLLTEITLPIDSMRNEEYVLNEANLNISAIITPADSYKPSVPATLIMIRKSKAREFFDKINNVDNVEAVVSSYQTKYGTYSFSNIASMVENIYVERDNWLNQEGKTLKDGGMEAYEQAYPDWNKVVLIPVTATYNSRYTPISYNLDTKMHQVKLIGGDTKIKIKTIRSAAN